MTGKLWNLTCVVRAGRYFVSRLLRLTGLKDGRNPRTQHSVRLGRKFHANFSFWDWVINRKFLQVDEAPSVDCSIALKRPAKRYFFSDASSAAVGGYCVENKVFWSYDLPPALPTELKREA